MRLANYWTKDYLKQEKLDEAHMDRKNAFIIYAMKYRDALLLRWEKTVKEKYPDRNTVEFRNKMKDVSFFTVNADSKQRNTICIF